MKAREKRRRRKERKERRRERGLRFCLHQGLLTVEEVARIRRNRLWRPDWFQLLDANPGPRIINGWLR